MTGRDLLVFFTLGDTALRLLAHSDQRLSRAARLGCGYAPVT